MPAGRPKAVAISALVKPPFTIKLVRGVTKGLPAGALRVPLKGSPVSTLVPPLSSITPKHAGVKVKSPEPLVVVVAPPQETAPPAM